MELGDLLYELRENILHDRSDMVAGPDGPTDYLWSDRTLIRYIDEAQRRFARETLVLRDGTTPQVTQVTLKTGITEYALDSSVLGVLSARFTGDTADLVRAGHSGLDTYRSPETYFFDPSQFFGFAPGKPLAYATDDYLTVDDGGTSSAMTLRVFPPPDTVHDVTVIKLRVVRLPLNRLDIRELHAEPEIPEDHHMEMLDWAAYLALRVPDIDAGAPARALEFRSSFEDHVARAKKAMLRKVFSPLNWNFGRNAFSWES